MTSGREYPYMYARVSSKRAKLLDSDDYEKLLKMQPNEIARYLEERDYEQEINELGARYDGVRLVELALNRNLSRVFSHMSEIAPEQLEKIISAYLRKYDIISLKRLLRWKKGGEKNRIEDMLIPVGSMSFERLEELSGKSFDEIKDSIEFPGSEIDYASRLEDAEDLGDIERALDEAYYDELEVLESEINSRPFSRFVRKEIELENLKTALRLKRYGFEPGEISEHLIRKKSSGIVDRVLEAEGLDEAMDAVVEAFDLELGDRRLEDLEHALETGRLQEALKMLHTEPLGSTSILGYMVAKMIEVKNLRMLIRAKEAGIQNLETIRSNLVIAER